MMLMGGIMLFMMMSVGCILCILAKKEAGALKTTAYTLAACLALLAMMHGYQVSDMQENHGWKKCHHEGAMYHKGMQQGAHKAMHVKK